MKVRDGLRRLLGRKKKAKAVARSGRRPAATPAATPAAPRPIDYFHTPYGCRVPVFPAPDGRPRADLDGVMTLAGIHAPADRDRCREALLQTDGMPPLSFFLAYGGRVAPIVPLSKPAHPVGGRVTAPAAIVAALRPANWDERAAELLKAAAASLQGSDAGGGRSAAERFPEALTAALETIAEADLSRLEAAAMYALTVHPEWVAAARSYLDPMRETWFAEWRTRHPAYALLAAICGPHDERR